MADIDIVPKKHSGTAWLWILLAIVAVVLIMWMMMGRSPSRSTRAIGDGYPVASTSEIGWTTAS